MLAWLTFEGEYSQGDTVMPWKLENENKEEKSKFGSSPEPQTLVMSHDWLHDPLNGNHGT